MAFKCSACGAPILWATTAANRRSIPLDAEPHEQGNIGLAGTTATTLTKAELDAARAASRTLFRSHWATCPQAASFRRKPK